MFWKIIAFIFRFILLISLPFIVLIRGAIWTHKEYNALPWLAILFGTIVMAFVLIIYFTYVYGKITGRAGNKGWLKRRLKFALIVALGYVLQSALFLSAKNAKSAQVKKEFRNLHPILRMSISTFLLMDRSLLVTDANRAPEDYKRMGLPTKSHSLHYPQSSGYAHAVDVRTKGKAEWKNSFMKLYFRLMGFKTLRHGGTADHLHISLFSHDTPHSI